MAAVSGQATTYNLQNHVGELFFLDPADTPFLSMIGGLTGGISHNAVKYHWQTTDNNAAAQPATVEGADPTYEERDRADVSNVLQIFQYGFEISYTKQAATGQVASKTVLQNQPVSDEYSIQHRLKLERAKRDVEFSMLQGTFQDPASNTTGRKMRGLKNAITTNTAAAGTTQLSKAHLDEVLREMADSGAPMDNVVLLCNAFQRQRISEIYGYAPEDRQVGGLAIKQVWTDFAQLGVVYDRHMPTGEVYIVDVAHCAPVFLEIPGKGHFFTEEVAATGASRKYQLYGEIGLFYGPEKWHGSVTGLATS